jgi:hypothetical protein
MTDMGFGFNYSSLLDAKVWRTQNICIGNLLLNDNV